MTKLPNEEAAKRIYERGQAIACQALDRLDHLSLAEAAAALLVVAATQLRAMARALAPELVETRAITDAVEDQLAASAGAALAAGLRDKKRSGEQ